MGKVEYFRSIYVWTGIWQSTGYSSIIYHESTLHAIGWVILTMVVVILAYDQLLFRPLVAWADKFRMENTASAHARSPGCWT